MWTGMRQQLSKINTAAPVFLKGHPIVSACSVTCLGVTIDSELTFAQHIKRVAAKCFYQLRQLWAVRHALSVDNATKLVHALVSSRVDYCNSVLYCVAAVHLRPLPSSLKSTSLTPSLFCQELKTAMFHLAYARAHSSLFRLQVCANINTVHYITLHDQKCK